MKPQILVVDDSLTVRMDLRITLTAAGFRVTTCGTLTSAQTWLETGVFELVILDVLLPDGSGLELLKQIKSSESLRSIPVIMLSTLTEVNSRIHGLRMGADRYVGKPYDRKQVVQAAWDLLKTTDPNTVTPSQRTPNKKKLLLVDDSPTFINGLAAVLRQEGYEIAMAYSGEDAVELLAVESFDAVLIDLVLPGVDGIQTCRRVRAMKGMDKTIIVLMTATDHRNSRAAALAAGADEMTAKTADFRLLTTQLLCLLISKRQRNHRHNPVPAELCTTDVAIAKRAGDLFENIITASGLSGLIAKSVLNGVLARIGTDRTQFTSEHLKLILGPLSDALRTFLPDGELSQRMASVAALARPSIINPFRSDEQIGVFTQLSSI